MATYVYFQPKHNLKLLYIDLIFLSILFAQYFHLVIASFDQAGTYERRTYRTFSGEYRIVTDEGALQDSVTLLLFIVSFTFPGLIFLIA